MSPDEQDKFHRQDDIQRVLGRLEAGQEVGFNAINAHLTTLNGTVLHHAQILAEHTTKLVSIDVSTKTWWKSVNMFWAILPISIGATWVIARYWH